MIPTPYAELITSSQNGPYGFCPASGKVVRKNHLICNHMASGWSWQTVVDLGKHRQILWLMTNTVFIFLEGVMSSRASAIWMYAPWWVCMRWRRITIAYPSRCYGIFFARFASCLELTDSNAPEILFDMTLTVEDRLSTTQVKASGLTKTCRTLHEHDEWPVFLGNPLFGVLIKEIAWWPKTIHFGFIMCGYLCSHPSGCPSIPQYTQYQLQQDWFQGFGWSCRPTRPTAWWRFIWYILTSKPSIPLTVISGWDVMTWAGYMTRAS